MNDHQHDAILETLRTPLDAVGLDVEAVEISAAGRRRVVRVLVDKDGGITLDDLAEATTLVGKRLDDQGSLGEQPYTLEVTSPGTDRPLTEPRHWRRNVDRLVDVTRTDGTQVTGRITDAGHSSATLEVDGDPRPIHYADVAKAKIQVEFNRPRPQV